MVLFLSAGPELVPPTHQTVLIPSTELARRIFPGQREVAASDKVRRRTETSLRCTVVIPCPSEATFGGGAQLEGRATWPRKLTIQHSREAICLDLAEGNGPNPICVCSQRD